MLKRVLSATVIAAAAIGCATGDVTHGGSSGDGGRGDTRADGPVGMCMMGAPDEPDPDNFDANCDGIDGDVTAAVFVAPNGHDDSASGTRTLPFQTIGYAITQANLQG